MTPSTANYLLTAASAPATSTRSSATACAIVIPLECRRNHAARTPVQTLQSGQKPTPPRVRV